MIELKNIYKTFNPGDVNEVRALQGLDLLLEVGEFVTVIGSNGAGKSTLLNLLAGVYPTDEGTLTIANRDVTRWQEHQRASLIGRVFQDPLRGTAGSMTIEQNMAMALLRGKRRGLRIGVSSKNRNFFREQLALIGLGLENRLTHKVNLLSGGQRQALTLLMAALTQPRILLLDEHTAALDPGTAEQIANLTTQLVRENSLTTMMVTHNMQHALSLGNRTIMMHRGKIILDVRGEERARMTVADLVKKFAENRVITDVIALSN
ncbi:MAG: ATP-binding cassette domain-containing protein [Chloroflexota bacterium]|nr:ATP-binding cassette domain-containing protein [Chloroflexota bacterium]